MPQLCVYFFQQYEKILKLTSDARFGKCYHLCIVHLLCKFVSRLTVTTLPTEKVTGVPEAELCMLCHHSLGLY